MNKLKILKDGLSAIQEFSNDQDKLQAGLKILSPSNSGIIEFGSKFIDQYIQTLSDVLDCENDEVEWYVFDNDFGKKRLSAKAASWKSARVIDTPEKLLKLIEEF